MIINLLTWPSTVVKMITLSVTAWVRLFWVHKWTHALQCKQHHHSLIQSIGNQRLLTSSSDHRLILQHL